MTISFAQARTIVQQAIADSSNSTFVDQCLDLAQAEVARSRRWNELYVRAFVLTSAAYDTGTVAFTGGGTTWTLTGGTFPTDVASGSYRIAKSVNDPFYTVVTRTDGTHVETAAIQEATVTASGFIVYKSHISLPSAVDRVEEVWIHDDGNAVALINATTDQQVSNFQHFPTGVGVPTHFYMMERDSSGNRQLLLGPDTPDDVKRVEFTYRKKITSGTFTGNLDDSRFPIILARALSLAYAPEFWERSQVEYAKYQRLLDDEWARENEVETQSVRVGQNRVNFPGMNDMEGLIGRGVVTEPTV